MAAAPGAWCPAVVSCAFSLAAVRLVGSSAAAAVAIAAAELAVALDAEPSRSRAPPAVALRAGEA